MNKKKGFTLVELLAVIVVLAIILVIAVPKILDVIKSSRENSLISSVKLVARNAEQKKLANEVLGETEDFDCSEVADLSENDYQSCIINFDTDGNATVTITGKGKFSGYTCSGTKNNVTCGDAEPLVCAHGYEYSNFRIKSTADKDDCVEKLKGKYLDAEYEADMALANATLICKNELAGWMVDMYDAPQDAFDEWGMTLSDCINYDVLSGIYTYEDIEDYFDVDIIGCKPNYLAQDWTIKSGFSEDLFGTNDSSDVVKSIVFHKSTSGFDGTGIDVSEAQDGNIKLYFDEDTGLVDIVSNEIIYFPKDSSRLFNELQYLDAVNFNDSIDTSKVVSMKQMFVGVGIYSSLELNISSFVIQDGCDISAIFGCYPAANWPDDWIEYYNVVMTSEQKEYIINHYGDHYTCIY